MSQLLKSGHEWLEDKSTDVCLRCSKKFGLLPGSRKHHCRICGKIFCSSCAPDPTNGLERKCVTCKIPRCLLAFLVNRRLKGWEASQPFHYDGTAAETIIAFLDGKSRTALMQSCRYIQRSFHVPTLPYFAKAEDRFPQLRHAGTVLGKGGGGTVHLVSDPQMHVLVAVKLVDKSEQWGYSAWRRLLSEIGIQSSCKHPNIAQLYEAFQTPTHAVFSMRVGEGKTLRHAFENVRRQQGDMEVFTLYVVREITKALKYLFNDLRVVHRDIKPDNIVLSADYSTVLLIDFGLAERVESDTQTYCPCGTKGFASPENIAAVNRGEPRFMATGAMMHESDIFSLGVVAYILLSGTKPFKNVGFREMQQQLAQGLHCTGSKWDSISLPTKQLVEWMLLRNYERRVTPDEIFAHESMKDLDTRIFPLLQERQKRQLQDTQEVMDSFDTIPDLDELIGEVFRIRAPLP